MKPSFRSSILLIAFIVSTLAGRGSSAQQQQPRGALRFANASGATGRVLFTIDGRKWRPDGFGPGEATTFIGVLAGSHRLNAVMEAAKPIEINFELQQNTDTTVIAYIRPVLDPQTHQTVQQCQLFAQPEPPHEKGKHFYIMYVSPRPESNVSINGQPRTLKALQLQKADDLARANIKIDSAGKPIFDFTAQENGTFLVIIFDRQDGTLGGMMLPNYG